MTFKLLYPEPRLISGMLLIVRARDAFENGDTDEAVETVEDAIRVLENIGHITIDRKYKER
jgi:hypothetical protein